MNPQFPELCLSLSLLFCLALDSTVATYPYKTSRDPNTVVLFNPATSSRGTSEALGPLWVGCDLRAVVVSSVPAEAELCSQGRHYMHRDETCSDSRFAPECIIRGLLSSPSSSCALTRPALTHRSGEIFPSFVDLDL